MQRRWSGAITYPAETYCYTLADDDNLLLTIAAVQCSGGPETCVVNCNVCNPQFNVCMLAHQRRSCNAAN